MNYVELMILIDTYIAAEVETAATVQDAETDPLPKYFEIEISL